jgi:hypothetical protein
MAYVPEMSYSPEMGIKVKVGKKALKKTIGKVNAVASVVPLPQTQAISAVSKVASKAKAVSSAIKSSKNDKATNPASKNDKATPASDTSNDWVEPAENSDNKILGLDKKIVLIGGGAVGLVLLLVILKK